MDVCFTNLSKYDGQGNEYEYSVRERKIPDMHRYIRNMTTGYEIKNFEPDTVDVEGKRLGRTTITVTA